MLAFFYCKKNNKKTKKQNFVEYLMSIKRPVKTLYWWKGDSRSRND